MSQLAETLAKENKLGPKDKLLANIFETLDDQHLGPQETLNGATKTLKTLTENQQANIAGFAIDNYRREHDKRSVLLQVIAIIAVFVVAPIWITRRFLGREPMTKWLRRKRTNERKIEKRANPFLRIAAKLGDLLVASLLGCFFGIVFGSLSGIVHLWVTGEISDTTWGVNTTINLFALMLSSGIYLLFVMRSNTHIADPSVRSCAVSSRLPARRAAPVTIGVSAKRNGPFALSFMLVIPCAIMANSTAYPMPDFVREQNDILNGLIDVGAVIFVILSLEEFRWPGSRTDEPCWIDSQKPRSSVNLSGGPLQFMTGPFRRPTGLLLVRASMPPVLNISIRSRTTLSLRQNCWATALRSNPMSKERITRGEFQQSHALRRTVNRI